MLDLPDPAKLEDCGGDTGIADPGPAKLQLDDDDLIRLGCT